MMGIAVPNLEMPVVKNTNAVLAFNEKDACLPEPTACIKCGNCINHCPLKLSPTEIETAYRVKNAEKLGKLKVNLCMECGCCSYICPANGRWYRPISWQRPCCGTGRSRKNNRKNWNRNAAALEREEAAAK